MDNPKIYKYILLFIIIIGICIGIYYISSRPLFQSRIDITANTEHFQSLQNKYCHTVVLLKKAYISATAKTDSILTMNAREIYNNYPKALIGTVHSIFRHINNATTKPCAITKFRICTHNDIIYLEDMLDINNAYYFHTIPGLVLWDNKPVTYAFGLGKASTGAKMQQNPGYVINMVNFTNYGLPGRMFDNIKDTLPPVTLSGNKDNLDNLYTYKQQLKLQREDEGRLSDSENSDNHDYPFVAVHIIIEINCGVDMLKSMFLDANILQPFIFMPNNDFTLLEPVNYVVDLASPIHNININKQYLSLYETSIDFYNMNYIFGSKTEDAITTRQITVSKTTVPITTQPLLLDMSSKFAQRMNLIGTRTHMKNVNMPLTGTNTPTRYKSVIALTDVYLLSQLLFTNIIAGPLSTTTTLEIHVANKSTNENQVIDLSAKLISATNNLYVKEPKSRTQDDIIGDEIILYTSAELDVTNIKLFVYGVLARDKYKEIVYEGVEQLPLNAIKFYPNINQLKGFESTMTSANIESYIVSKMIIVFKSPLPSAETKFKVVFKNNYSNDIITYNGPVNGEFIYNPDVPDIAEAGLVLAFTNTLLANTISVEPFTFGQYIDRIDFYGYKTSVSDINKFKLEYSVTDIRGSINPDDICPSIDKFMENQVTNDIIVDAIDYQRKINDEKDKLFNYKTDLVTIDEQKREIMRLKATVDKIKRLQSERDMQTSTMNALQLQKQLNAYNKLKLVLDERLNSRKKHTYGVDLNIRKVDDAPSTTTADILEPFTATEDNYKLYGIKHFT